MDLTGPFISVSSEAITGKKGETDHTKDSSSSAAPVVRGCRQGDEERGQGLGGRRGMGGDVHICNLHTFHCQRVRLMNCF